MTEDPGFAFGCLVAVAASMVVWVIVIVIVWWAL